MRGGLGVGEEWGGGRVGGGGGEVGGVVHSENGM